MLATELEKVASSGNDLLPSFPLPPLPVPLPPPAVGLILTRFEGGGELPPESESSLDARLVITSSFLLISLFLPFGSFWFLSFGCVSGCVFLSVVSGFFVSVVFLVVFSFRLCFWFLQELNGL